VRRLLQKLGTECVRDILGEDAWIQALYKRLLDDGVICDCCSPVEWKADVVVTDCRFPNEAEFIGSDDMRGQVWRVVRPNFDNGLPPLHPSEALVDELPVDRQLFNDGTIEDLARWVHLAMGTRRGE